MLGIRASAKRLRETLRVTSLPRANRDLSADNSALVAHAIYRREDAGQSTTLRQVHHIVGVGQPEALRLVRELEAEGMVVITDVIHDTWESKIELTDAMRDRLTRILAKDND